MPQAQPIQAGIPFLYPHLVPAVPEEPREIDCLFEVHRVVDQVRHEERVLLRPVLAPAAPDGERRSSVPEEKERGECVQGPLCGSSLFGPSIVNAEPLLLRKKPLSPTKTLEPKRWKMLWMQESTFPSRSATVK